MFKYILIKEDSFPSTATLLLSYLFTFPLALSGACVGVKSFVMEKEKYEQLIWSLTSLIIFFIEVKNNYLYLGLFLS